MNPVIETLDRTRRYGANRGITDVNLTVGQAEALGFLGPNGVGKTTTIRARLGLLPTEFTLDDRLTGDDLLRLVARQRADDRLGTPRHTGHGGRDHLICTQKRPRNSRSVLLEVTR